MTRTSNTFTVWERGCSNKKSGFSIVYLAQTRYFSFHLSMFNRYFLFQILTPYVIILLVYSKSFHNIDALQKIAENKGFFFYKSSVQTLDRWRGA